MKYSNTSNAPKKESSSYGKIMKTMEPEELLSAMLTMDVLNNDRTSFKKTLKTLTKLVSGNQTPKAKESEIQPLLPPSSLELKEITSIPPAYNLDEDYDDCDILSPSSPLSEFEEDGDGYVHLNEVPPTATYGNRR